MADSEAVYVVVGAGTADCIINRWSIWLRFWVCRRVDAGDIFGQSLTMHLRIGDQSVRVLAIEQRDVYANVIEGVPNAHINAGIVADALARARQLYGGSPHLVPPRERPLPSRDEPKVALPRVCCIAAVRGWPPRDPDADHGEACLVWFQDEITATVAPDVADSLGRLAWSDIAIDVFW